MASALSLHGLIFRGMLKQIARQALDAGYPSRLSVFSCRSVIPGSAADLFRWHERPEALLDLIPFRRWIRIEERTGDLRDGGRVAFSFGAGPVRARWEARHYGYLRGTQFCDEQVRGPFAIWRHTHRFEPIGCDRSLYEDRIEYAVPGGPLAQRFANPVLRWLLARAFGRRHQIVRAAMLEATQRTTAVESPSGPVVDATGLQRPLRRRRIHMAMLLLVVLPMASIEGQPQGPVRTVGAVDLDRYLGDWFEIARFPNRFQRTCLGDVRATYARRADGRLDVINRCLTAEGATEARGVARIVDFRTSAKLKVRFAPAVLSFLPFVWGDYWILGLADDYSWAVVGSPDRDYLWILARTPAWDAERFASALAAARSNGFDVERLLKTNHAATPRAGGDGAP